MDVVIWWPNGASIHARWMASREIRDVGFPPWPARRLSALARPGGSEIWQPDRSTILITSLSALARPSAFRPGSPRWKQNLATRPQHHSHHAAFHPGSPRWKRIWLRGTLLTQTTLPPRRARWRAAIWNGGRDLVAKRGFHPRKVDGEPGDSQRRFPPWLVRRLSALARPGGSKIWQPDRSTILITPLSTLARPGGSEFGCGARC